MLACDLASRAGWRQVSMPGVAGFLESHRGLPAEIGAEAERMLALVEGREVREDEVGSTFFAVAGPGATVRGIRRDDVPARPAPSAPSIVFLRVEDADAPRQAAGEAFGPARALLSSCGLPSGVTRDAVGALGHHVGATARLHAGGHAGGWIAAGASHDTDRHVARSIGASRFGRPVRLVVGEALSVGAAVASLLELGTSPAGLAVPSPLRPFMGGGGMVAIPVAGR